MGRRSRSPWRRRETCVRWGTDQPQQQQQQQRVNLGEVEAKRRTPPSCSGSGGAAPATAGAAGHAPGAGRSAGAAAGGLGGAGAARTSMTVLKGPVHPGVHQSGGGGGGGAPVPPNYVKVVVEVPQGSFVKRRPDGSVDFISPVPSPFNYGSVPDVPAADGDPLDAVVLGEQLPYGHTGVWRVRGLVRFVDDGVMDNKLICTQQGPPTRHAPTALRRARGGVGVGGGSRSTRRRAAESGHPDGLNGLDCLLLSSFFTTYALFKTALNAARGRFGRTAFDGLEFGPPVRFL